MSIIRWEKPPPRSRQLIDWREVARLLRSRPGEWAVVYEGKSRQAANGQMSQLRAGKRLPMLPVADFEYECREKTVYARYVGHGEPPEVYARRRAVLEAV